MNLYGTSLPAASPALRPTVTSTITIPTPTQTTTYTTSTTTSTTSISPYYLSSSVVNLAAGSPIQVTAVDTTYTVTLKYVVYDSYSNQYLPEFNFMGGGFDPSNLWSIPVGQFAIVAPDLSSRPNGQIVHVLVIFPFNSSFNSSFNSQSSTIFVSDFPLQISTQTTSASITLPGSTVSIPLARKVS